MILRLRLHRLFLKAGIYVLPILAFRLGWSFWRVICRIIDRPVLYFPQEHLSHIVLGTFVWVFFAEHYGVTTFDELFRERTGARKASTASMATSFVLLAGLYFTRNESFPRGLLVLEVITLLILTLLLHAVFRVLCRSGAHLAVPIRLLIVGSDQHASMAAARLQRLSFAPCEIVGFVRVPGQEVCVTGHPIYEMEQLELVTSDNGIDEVVIAVHPAQFPQIPGIILALNHLCLPARAIVDLGEGVVVRERLFQVGNMQMLDLVSTPTELLDYALLKRAFDIVFSFSVLLLTSPLFALIAALVKISSPGPVLFAQERVGLNGRPFRMYKFRTMHVAPEAESDTRWTTQSDPRKTRIGVFLRKTSLDELPQFINVLMGDMSVVGPRPERPHFVHNFLQEVARYNNRHALKVGITGWAQVNGWRGNTSIQKRIEYDLYYLQNWSLAFDLRIILMTIVSGLIAKNAY